MNYYSYKNIPDRFFGGKADGLTFLLRNRFTVPQYYIIPDDTVRNILAGSLSAESFFEAWKKNTNPDENSLWALRSSAGVEDGTHQSYAGIFTTVLNCSTKSLPAALVNVIEGFKQVNTSGYHMGDGFSFHVVLQKMVQGEISGVGFSTDPLDHDGDHPLINILPGLGFKLVSGEENGMEITLSSTGPKAISKEETYKGEVFNGGYKPITLTGDALFLGITPYLQEIGQQLKKLEELKGFPVDTEFTLYNGRIYWLQVRPITSLVPKGAYTVWDNSNLSINYPGITLPLTSSYMLHSYSMAYKQMCRFLGSGNVFIERNKSLFNSMVGSIKGGMYYNITAWQQLLYQLPFGSNTSQMITKMLGADPAKFSKPITKASPIVYARLFLNLLKSILFFGKYKAKYLAQYEATRRQFEERNLDAETHQGLIAIYKEMEYNLGRYWYPPMINGFFAMLSYNGFKKVLSRSRLNDTFPNFLNDTIAGIGDVVSVDIVKALQDLIYRLHHNEMVKKILLEEDSSKALQAIEVHHSESYALITNYLKKYGERCDEGEMKMETVNYREGPSKFIALLKANLSLPYHKREQKEPFDYKKVLKEQYRYNPLKHLLLSWGLKFTINRVRDRENFRFIRTKSFAMARQIFRKMDKCLLNQGLIHSAGDSLYLTFEELTDPGITSYKETISKRKEEYELYQNEYRYVRYHEIEGVLYPIEKRESLPKGELSGTGCSSGIVIGEAVQVTVQNIQDLDVNDKILVAPFFEPGWIGVFARARGLVAERGSLLSHTAILCREMGIPLIVGVKKATTAIIHGEKIKINGATGSIEKVITHE
ncbi:PEP/pyruvate-binding domain-containing protein [Xanthocytophaga agilis]|uniref:PEP/pyruvate-binding domain-containing protein n=1 Tax=Xanthocytophaga agilis TaxID=3048010 RepID=A0AAE3RDR4_9BACT|nr:PEP/pyruvate-binding domain-containing protein [Xanthocytophaga agilis]MDJ1505913.1 PEP/pyruvate-binding domain-containing protein [Xanthocytophaga agilis]